jgi:hypothetical protein
MFPRLDKLTDHIRAVHAHDTPFSGCPVEYCGVGELPLDMLGAHIQRAHFSCKAEARSIMLSTTTRRRRCPLSGCNNKLFLLDAFLMHLEGHEAEEVRPAIANPCFESLVFDFAVVTGPGSAPTARINVGIACPVCSTISSTFEHFEMHLWSNHLFLDSVQGVEHFLVWKHALTQIQGSFSGLLPWHGSTIIGGETTGHPVHCPGCMHSVTNPSMTQMGVQHPGLMRSEEQIFLELSPVRMQILRLYPDFLTHPIFNDCA